MNNVLIIDDDIITLDIFSGLISSFGYKVITAESGEEGIEIFENEKPPIVLTDITMPGMNGIEVLKRIKEIDSTTEVIVVTADGDMDLAVEALNLNATDFINKPLQRPAIEKALKNAEERIKRSKGNAEEILVKAKEYGVHVHVLTSITSKSEATVQKALKEIVASGKDKIFIHFDENVSINGAGITILTEMLMDCQQKGFSVHMTALSDNFKKIFDIVGITRLVKICETEDDSG